MYVLCVDSLSGSPGHTLPTPFASPRAKGVEVCRVTGQFSTLERQVTQQARLQEMSPATDSDPPRAQALRAWGQWRIWVGGTWKVPYLQLSQPNH